MMRNIEKLYIFILIRMIILEDGDAKNLLISGTKHAKPIATRTHDDYQKCLQEKTSQKNPEALLVLEGSDVRLTCDGLCLNPSQSAKEIWHHLDEKTTSVMYVPLDGLRKKIRSDLSLSLHNILTKDSGAYFCYKDGKNYVTYHVDVKKTELTTVVRQSGKKGPFAKKEKHLGKNNLLIFTKWSKWSPCDRCGKVGRRRRVGVCMIKKLKANRPVVPEDVRILSSYPDGIPCRSSLLSEKLKNLRDIKERKSENMVGFCKRPCPTEASIVVFTDEDKKVVEVVDNSKGIFSMKQKLPEFPELVKRQTVYELVDRRIVLICPGPDDGINIIWRNGSWVLNPTRINRMTNGRVMIDLANNIHIRRLKIFDSSIYSCWDDKRLIGTVRLIVSNNVERSGIHFLALNIGVGLMFLVLFLIVYTRSII